MNNKNGLLKPKSTLSGGKRNPCRSMNSGPSPSCTAARIPLTAARKSLLMDRFHPLQNGYSREQESFMTTQNQIRAVARKTTCMTETSVTKYISARTDGTEEKGPAMPRLKAP